MLESWTRRQIRPKDVKVQALKTRLNAASTIIKKHDATISREAGLRRGSGKRFVEKLKIHLQVKGQRRNRRKKVKAKIATIVARDQGKFKTIARFKTTYSYIQMSSNPLFH